ncbi:uncharacterized protein LAJ45_10410 [Morchella importuna]|uniref:uncharacterized protein n=1 Tax=Morchella importuna TaxID=1174673 RepID=UPI001E8D0D43|nr:uncharacterized protein LAJ45_10410 [Morchella importuna]KAH8145609.1 hypothetical protein LAJ45_10410 [Morchella importuna]
MGDAQLSSEPTRNLIVSSTPYQAAPQEEHLAPDQQFSATVTPASSTTDRYPSSSQTSSANSSAMAAPTVQQSQNAAQQPRYTQQSYILTPYVQQRAASIGHGAPQTVFNMANMQRALPVYSPQQQQQQPQGAQAPPQAPHNQQQRFQTGPNPAAVTYQLPQPVPQFQSGAGAAVSGGGQYYHVPSFSPPYFDPYPQQHYIHTSAPQGQQDPQSQQQQGTFYTAGYPQFPQSAGPTQSHFGAPPWFGQPQASYYYIPQVFASPQVPGQHIPQIASQQHQQQHTPTASYGRRHSVPARGSPPKRRGSETDAVAFVGYNGVPQWDRNVDGHNFRNYVQPSRGPSGATTNVTTPNTLDIVSPSSLHPGMPRGPPRKPKQSGHALWVGNLPAGTQVMDLKEYFSREAKDDIESVFLISKSNCAFVNYRTELSCAQAMERFHDSRFQNTRLVCRLRRSSATSTVGAATPSPDPSADQSAPTSTSGDEGNKDGEVEEAPVEIKSPPIGPGGARAPSRETGRDRIFIVKSLTVEDLDLSVRNGIWATQNHNESTLNHAFETADNVYLIFSANKSGEYYGYARMTSPILDDPSNVIEWTPSTQQIDDPDLPKAIYTPATDSAPQGRIIDDSARGTIFWEALSGEEAPDNTKESDESGEKSTVVSKSWGKPFKVEWMSTSRVPFYRTRGLRNLWNANREVKIARDGTELEETVGKRLIQMFHRNNGGAMPPVMAGGHVGLMLPQHTPNRGNAISH